VKQSGEQRGGEVTWLGSTARWHGGSDDIDCLKKTTRGRRSTRLIGDGVVLLLVEPGDVLDATIVEEELH
jgi:hypothetical protein